MDAQDKQRLQACVDEISEILYRNTPPEKLTNLEAIELAVRDHMLTHVSPKIGFFLSKRQRAQSKEKSASSKAVLERSNLKPTN
jgi:hypothetical protein